MTLFPVDNNKTTLFDENVLCSEIFVDQARTPTSQLFLQFLDLVRACEIAPHLRVDFPKLGLDEHCGICKIITHLCVRLRSVVKTPKKCAQLLRGLDREVPFE